MEHMIEYGPYEHEISYEDLAKSVGPGWRPMVIYLCQVCKAHGVSVAQVKEKFGGLRFYLGGVAVEIADEIFAIVDAAETMSYKICERCGDMGEPRKGGWIKTLCDKCETLDRARA